MEYNQPRFNKEANPQEANSSVDVYSYCTTCPISPGAVIFVRIGTITVHARIYCLSLPVAPVDSLTRNRDFTFTTGGALNGRFPVTSVTNANVFVIKSKNNQVSTGNVTLLRGLRGTYDFDGILDLGGVYSVNLKRHFQSIGFFLGGDVQTAMYTQSGTTVTVNKNSHGRSVDDSIVFDATAGAGGVCSCSCFACCSLNSASLYSVTRGLLFLPLIGEIFFFFSKVVTLLSSSTYPKSVLDVTFNGPSGSFFIKSF